MELFDNFNELWFWRKYFDFRISTRSLTELFDNFFGKFDELWFWRKQIVNLHGFCWTIWFDDFFYYFRTVRFPWMVRQCTNVMSAVLRPKPKMTWSTISTPNTNVPKVSKKHQNPNLTKLVKKILNFARFLRQNSDRFLRFSRQMKKKKRKFASYKIIDFGAIIQIVDFGLKNIKFASLTQNLTKLLQFWRKKY